MQDPGFKTKLNFQDLKAMKTIKKQQRPFFEDFSKAFEVQRRRVCQEKRFGAFRKN